MVTTLVEVNEDEVDPNDIITDHSINLVENQFMVATGVTVHRGCRIAWPPLDLKEVVESLVVGEGEEAEIVQDFAGKEGEQREWDLLDREVLAQSELLQVALIGNDLASPYEEQIDLCFLPQSSINFCYLLYKRDRL